MKNLAKYLTDDDFEAPVREPIRRSTEPVNSRHESQRKAENAINRGRKLKGV